MVRLIMMRKINGWVIAMITGSFLLGSALSEARDLGVQGAVFAIQERSLLDVIKEKLVAWQMTHQLDNKMQTLQTQFRGRLTHLPNVSGTTPALAAGQRWFDPSIILQRPVMGENGRVLAVPGQRINPLAMVHLKNPMVFIDPSRVTERRWLLSRAHKTGTVIIVVGGDWLALSKKLGRFVYYDQQGSLGRRLQIRHTPTIVTQVGGYLQLTEVVV
jgi:conjugal transfer pilus assembly protein TraW